MSVERVNPSDENAVATYNALVQAAWRVDVGIRPCPFPPRYMSLLSTLVSAKRNPQTQIGGFLAIIE